MMYLHRLRSEDWALAQAQHRPTSQVPAGTWPKAGGCSFWLRLAEKEDRQKHKVPSRLSSGMATELLRPQLLA